MNQRPTTSSAGRIGAASELPIRPKMKGGAGLKPRASQFCRSASDCKGVTGCSATTAVVRPVAASRPETTKPWALLVACGA